MTLQDGQSDLDVMTVALPDAGIELTSCEEISLTSSVLVPCDAFSVTVLQDDPQTALLLRPGVKIQISVNDRLQFTGFVDKRSTRAARGAGTTVTVTGRDILSPLIDSNVDPKLKFTETMTLADVIAAILNSYGITTIYNDGSLNVNIQTGVVQKPTLAATTTSVQIQTQTVDASGKVDSSYVTKSATFHQSPKKTNLKSLNMAQLKPHDGEGVHELIDRILKRFGLRMWAAADGSGVIIDAPDFTLLANPQKITHSRTDESANNVRSGDATFDVGGQPSCIVARGTGSVSADLTSSTIRVIAINELAGTDENGNPLPYVKDILAAYKDAKVLAVRPELKVSRRSFSDSLTARPMFLKDDESRNLDQLSSFARREMAKRQHKALQVKYELIGLTVGGAPWAPNTMVTVADEVLDINGPLYMLEREFTKARHGGTSTKATCVLPHSLDYTT